VSKRFNLQAHQATISNMIKTSLQYLSSNIEKSGAKRHKVTNISELEKVLYEWFIQTKNV
jgi:endonuclease III